MKKREILGFGFFAVLIIFLSAIVSAQYSGLGYELRRGSEMLIDFIKQIFVPIFISFLGGKSELLFERIMFFVIMIALIYVSLSRFPLFQDKKGPLWIITIVVSILATRFLIESEIVKTMLLPYSVLGVSLTAAVPFIIYFFFVQSFDDNPVLRKILWVFFIVVFLGLWDSRSVEVGKLAGIYLLTGILALICLLADGTIRRIMIAQQMKQLDIHNREGFVRDIRKQIGQLEEDKLKGFVTESHYHYLKRRLQHQLKDVLKN